MTAQTNSMRGFILEFEFEFEDLFWRCNMEIQFEDSIYRKSSIRSRPCIILNPKFHRLVLEVFQKI